MNKKGGMMVEAAVVFPVIILALLAVLYMLIYFYSQVGEQVKMHIKLRSECGLICENMYYGNQDDSQITFYRDGNSIYCYSSVDSYGSNMLENWGKELSAEKYLIDETAVVRMVDLAGNVAGEFADEHMEGSEMEGIEYEQ